MSRIYLSAPHMSGLERAFVDEAFESNWMTALGPNVSAFEREFGELLGRPAAALSSGTAALHLALRLLGVGRGDLVLCPTLTFVATANPVIYQGAVPLFLDSERQSWNLDPNVLEDALKTATVRPKAVIVVHLFGQPAEMDSILEITRRYDVPVIEDAAEALGADYKGKPVGALGDVAAFSFNGNKIITTTAGGMLVCADEGRVERVKFWASQAREPGIGYQHKELGFNYRMSNVLAGIGRGQLRVLNERVRQRRAIAFRYRDAFRELDGLQLMPQAPWGLHTNWLSCFSVDENALGCARDDIIDELARCDIEARPVWKPLHRQPLFEGAPCLGGSIADDLHQRGICLPSSSFLTESQQDRVIEAVRSAVTSKRTRGKVA